MLSGPLERSHPATSSAVNRETTEKLKILRNAKTVGQLRFRRHLASGGSEIDFSKTKAKT